MFLLQNSEKFMNLWLLAPLSIIIFFVLVTIIWKIIICAWKVKAKKRESNRFDLNEKSKLILNEEISMEYLNEDNIDAFDGFKKKEETFDISFLNLGLELKNGTKVLSGVTGSIKSGRLTAIMGPSGSGVKKNIPFLAPLFNLMKKRKQPFLARTIFFQ